VTAPTDIDDLPPTKLQQLGLKLPDENAALRRQAAISHAKNLAHRLLGMNKTVEQLFDRWLIRRRFKSRFGKFPDLKHPKTFSEKVIHKLLYDRRPILTDVADKIKMRDFVQSRVGKQYLSQIYQITKNPEEINWDALPSQFVLKTNHGSGWNIIVSDKNNIDKAAATAQLREWTKKNFYRWHREWAYRGIKPLVFVEEMLQDENNRLPEDWKFFTFSGRALYLQCDRNRFLDHQQNLYDRNLTRVDVRYVSDNFPLDPMFPANMEEMFDVAERLGKGFDFIRVDLYNIKGRIVVGELTNYPNAGLIPFKPAEFDEQLGSHWKLLNK
jgi:hypothetical protein